MLRYYETNFRRKSISWVYNRQGPDSEIYEGKYLIIFPGQLILLYSPADFKANALYDKEHLSETTEEISGSLEEIEEGRIAWEITDTYVRQSLIDNLIEEDKKSREDSISF